MKRSEALKIRATIESAVQFLPDSVAVESVDLYPVWKPGVTYKTGVRFSYNDRLFEVLQDHTSQADWKPDTVASLYVEINETNTGEVDNPIPYYGNMRLQTGKHYSQDGVIYRCILDTVNPVYADLKALVGLYVEIEY